jgi:hypothetical protein
MWTDPTTRKVHGRKGFMKLEEYLDFIHKMDFDKMNVVFHFRIATHGGVNAQATHPFPVSDRNAELNALTWEARAGIAHNGIVPGFGTKQGLSDTQEWISKVASKAGEHIMHPGVLKVLEATIGQSRVVIMRRDKIVRLGEGWTQFKGCWYSNSGYKKPAAVVCYNRQWDDWEGDGKAWWKNNKTSKWSGYGSGSVLTLPPLPPATKEAEPVKSDVSYKDHVDAEDKADKELQVMVEKNMRDFPGWCKGHCSTCGYLEDGFCIIDDIKTTDLQY